MNHQNSPLAMTMKFYAQDMRHASECCTEASIFFFRVPHIIQLHHFAPCSLVSRSCERNRDEISRGQPRLTARVVLTSPDRSILSTTTTCIL